MTPVYEAAAKKAPRDEDRLLDLYNNLGRSAL